MPKTILDEIGEAINDFVSGKIFDDPIAPVVKSTKPEEKEETDDAIESDEDKRDTRGAGKKPRSIFRKVKREDAVDKSEPESSTDDEEEGETDEDKK